MPISTVKPAPGAVPLISIRVVTDRHIPGDSRANSISRKGLNALSTLLLR